MKWRDDRRVITPTHLLTINELIATDKVRQFNGTQSKVIQLNKRVGEKS
jgi:hypothetical protein